MTFTLELTPTQEARLREEAARAGMEPAALLIARAGLGEQEADTNGVGHERDAQERLSARLPGEDKTLALFAQWAQEDAAADPVEQRRRQQEGDALLNALRNNRLTLEGRTDLTALADGDAI